MRPSRWVSSRVAGVIRGFFTKSSFWLYGAAQNHLPLALLRYLSNFRLKLFISLICLFVALRIFAFLRVSAFSSARRTFLALSIRFCPGNPAPRCWRGCLPFLCFTFFSGFTTYRDAGWLKSFFRSFGALQFHVPLFCSPVRSGSSTERSPAMSLAGARPSLLIIISREWTSSPGSAHLTE